MTTHLISRVSILGTGLIGGSFALALRKYATDLHISGWDRPDVARAAQSTKAFDETFTGDLGPAVHHADLIFVALPIGVTLDLLPELARSAPRHALITDACSTKLRIAQTAGDLFAPPDSPLFLPGHPMAGREHAGITHADADLFRNAPYALISDPAVNNAATSASLESEPAQPERDPRVSAFPSCSKTSARAPFGSARSNTTTPSACRRICRNSSPWRLRRFFTIVSMRMVFRLLWRDQVCATRCVSQAARTARGATSS